MERAILTWSVLLRGSALARIIVRAIQGISDSSAVYSLAMVSILRIRMFAPEMVLALIITLATAIPFTLVPTAITVSFLSQGIEKEKGGGKASFLHKDRKFDK